MSRSSIIPVSQNLPETYFGELIPTVLQELDFLNYVESFHITSTHESRILLLNEESLHRPYMAVFGPNVSENTILGQVDLFVLETLTRTPMYFRILIRMDPSLPVNTYIRRISEGRQEWRGELVFFFIDTKFEDEETYIGAEKKHTDVLNIAALKYVFTQLRDEVY